MTIRIDGTNTAANPGITGTDTDTGLQFGTDEVNIVTGGTTRTTVDSSGRLLVGTTSAPTSGTQSHYGKLIVSGSSAGNTHAYAAFITGSTAETQGPEVSRLVFGNTNAEYGRIDVALDGTAGTSSAPGRMVFYTTASGATSPTERLRITSDGTFQLRNSPGIDFSQIQTNATGMTSETLDSYEEGTWTPVYNFSTSGAATCISDGYYTKIGKMVFVQGYVRIQSSNTLTGDATITGLPYTATQTGQARHASLNIGEARRFNTDMAYLRLLVNQNSTSITLTKNTTSVSSTQVVTNSDFVATAGYDNLSFSGCYEVQ